jgi:arginase
MAHSFDLTLSFPQWQGSGRNENLLRGGLAAAQVCGRYAPLVEVPLSEDTSEADNGIRRWPAVLEQFRNAQAVLAEHSPKSILTAGGDCAVDIPVIDYLHGLYPDLTVIWIDAHLDANTPQTTPSGSFHGMPVATILGYAPEAMQPLLRNPLPAVQFRYAGVHVGDDGEWEFQRTHGLQWLEDESEPTGPIHIHFDLDVFDPVDFPYLAYHDGRLKVEDGIALLRRLTARSQVVGLTFTEFSPADAEAAQTGSKVVARLCEAAGLDQNAAWTSISMR